MKIPPLPFKRKWKLEIPKKMFEAETIEARDIIAPPSVEITSEYLKLGKILAKSFFIFSYPRYLHSGWLGPLINLETPLDISIFIHPVESETILRQLTERLAIVQAEIAEKEQKGFVRDPALEITHRDIEELRNKLQSAQEKVFRLGVYLTVYTDSPEKFRDIETNIRSIFESRAVYIKPAIFQQKEGFTSSLPYGMDLLAVHTTMNTAPISSTFPFLSFDLSSNEGILYGVNKHNNSLVLFDRFSLENANFVCFAKSGSGKSILGSESVLIKRNNSVTLTKIGPLVENLIKRRGITKIDEELEGVIDPGIDVYSFDGNLKGNWSKATVAARKKAPGTFYKFTTRSGRQITTTGDHNMIVLKNGRVITAKSSEINQGEFIPLPRKTKIESYIPANRINLLEVLHKSWRIYIKGGGNIIAKNYAFLQKTTIDSRYDKYLYKYRSGSRIPIQYFNKILSRLEIKNSDPALNNLKIISKNGKAPGFSINFSINQEFAKIAGYICSEGAITKDAIIISNEDGEVLKDLDSSLKKMNVPFYYGSRGIIIACRAFVEIIKGLGGGGYSSQKKVLPLIFNLDKEKITRYLAAYFEGDGGVEQKRFTVSATSKSRELISEISYLLYYFGIIARISKTKKKPSNYGWKRKKSYYKLTISGQDNLRSFAQNVNFVSQRKRGQLSGIIGKKGNTNVDVIPGINLILREISQLFSFQLHNIQDLSNLKREHYNPSPEKLNEIISKIEDRVRYFKQMEPTYRTLSELPELAAIINWGKADKNLNKELWQVLGQSWRIVKNGGVAPGCRNGFKIAGITTKQSFSSIKDIKCLIHSGFQEMDLLIKYYNPSLQSALVERPDSDTSYQMVQKAAQYVWQNYQNILRNNIPLVEEKLNQLKVLANSDLFWDPIVKIKKFENKKEEYVYDLTVDNEVFLAGEGGMFVHNSYAIKLEVLRSMMLGVDSIIIDPENEYKLLSDAVGGSFLNMSLSSPLHINPFDLPVPREDEKPEDVLRSNIINLVGLMRLMLGGLNSEEDAIMDRALAETYAAKDITPETDPTTWAANIPLMRDLEMVLKGMEGAESLVQRLKKFTSGTFAEFFNRQTNISMDKPLVVFGIRDMEDELRPMAMFVIMRYIWNKIRSELKKRILVVDEAWWLMKSDDGASFLFGVAKRARKYWLGVTTITQDVNDFMKSTYGPPIITNSSLQLLLKQSPATIDTVQKTFNLTDEEKYLLLETEIGEGIFFAGLKHVAIKIMASRIEDQIITTSPEQMLKIKKEKKKLEYGGV